MASIHPSSLSLRHRTWRFSLAAASLLLALTAFGAHQSFLRDQNTVLQVAEHLDLDPSSGLLLRIKRESDPQRARMMVARFIVAAALEPDSQKPRGRHLDLARSLAQKVQLQRPTNWEAPMILGAATYLDWSLQRDGRLFRSPETWQDPLLRSLELAPSRVEPTRFLASAYLEVWPALSAEKQQLAQSLLRRAMEDTRHFRRLIAPWLSRAKDRQEAFSVVPDDPDAWRFLIREYAGLSDWPAVREAYDLLQSALRNEVFTSMEQAEFHLAGRDLRGARHLFLTAASVAPLESAMDPVINRALSRCPPGAYSAHYARSLRRHLDRTFELFLTRSSPLDPEVVARLTLASGELDPPEQALAALASNDLVRAELLERRSQAPPGAPEWSAFRIALSRALLQRGDLAAAKVSLASVDPVWRDHPLFWLVRRDLAMALSDRDLLDLANDRLRLMARNRLPAQAWKRKERAYRLEWLAGEKQESVEIQFTHVNATGTVLEARLDGSPIGTFQIQPGGLVSLEISAAAGEVHYLELESLAPVLFTPGEVTFSKSSRAAAAAPHTTANARELAGIVKPKSTHS